MNTFFNIIKQKELEQKKELNQFIDQIFFESFNKFPIFIQEIFFKSYKKFFKKENLPIQKISSLNKQEYDFYTLRLNNYSSFVDILHFHSDLDFLYCDEKIETLFRLHAFSISEESRKEQLIILRGLFYLIDKDIFYRHIKKHNLFNIIDELKSIDSVKVSNSFTDNQQQFSEEFDALINIVNF